jgi:hypothetical protein
MPTISKAHVWYPPEFPLQGRLPQTSKQVYQNLYRQEDLEQVHYDALCLAAGKRRPRPCCKTVHISLFFDGTGNNLNNDLYKSSIPHPTNIARLFRAAIGEGHAGGTTHSTGAGGLTDAAGVGNGQYFKYYMPGVGTPFPEVGDLDYTSEGLAYARRGEERINWALLMIIDALRRALKQPRLDNAALRAAVEAMGTWQGTEWIMGWGDGSQAIPKGALVKRCLHIAASHEQRLSFPLDSIRREDGTYPNNSQEVIYPGVHSDQGGGYPPGDQGKAVGGNDGLLLSQIALNDLYADAFNCGAPFKVPETALPYSLKGEQWRVLDLESVKEFDTSTR